jgi:hypothetical protein
VAREYFDGLKKTSLVGKCVVKQHKNEQRSVVPTRSRSKKFGHEKKKKRKKFKEEDEIVT